MAAFSTEAANLAKQRALSETRKAKTQLVLKALFSYLGQHKNKTNLLFINLLSGIGSATDYHTSGTGNIYALFVKNRDASAVFAKITDTASGPVGGMFNGSMLKIPASDEVLFLWPDGLALANGFSVRVDTSGSVAAEPTTAATGFAIVG